MKKSLLFIIIFLLTHINIYAQACCGNGLFDVSVLSLNKRAMFGINFRYDNYLGIWDDQSQWRKLNYTSYQLNPSFSTAYRFNRHFQIGISIPYVINKKNLPGLPDYGSGIGDISLNGRYEIFHEFEEKEIGRNIVIDKSKPYLAIIFGAIFPTGISDETANSDVDITGRGSFSSIIGLSAVKTLVRDKLQFGTDINWQHNFEQTYEKYFNEPLTTPFTRQIGDRFNFATSLNYILNLKNSFAIYLSGFLQNSLKVEETKINNSDEALLNFAFAYSYYPTTYLRFNSILKWNLPVSNIGKNSSGSLTFTLNLIYYIETLDF
jgi:hypothetical protein